MAMIQLLLCLCILLVSSVSSARILEEGGLGITTDVQIDQEERKSGDQNRVRIKAENGKYIQVKTGKAVTPDAAGDGGWGDDDPTVFKITVVSKHQVTNGYGPTKAPEIMKVHENERTKCGEDPSWLVDSTRLESPSTLFKWAKTHGLRIIIDLHAAKGSQNDFDHNSSRDGSQEWGMTDESIKATVDVIAFLTTRSKSEATVEEWRSAIKDEKERGTFLKAEGADEGWTGLGTALWASIKLVDSMG